MKIDSSLCFLIWKKYGTDKPDLRQTKSEKHFSIVYIAAQPKLLLLLDKIKKIHQNPKKGF